MTDDLVEKVALGIDDFLSRTGVPLEMAEAMHCARSALSAIEDAGWCVVPAYPTREMAYAPPDNLDGVAVEDIYTAMLSARPRITGETT